MNVFYLFEANNTVGLGHCSRAVSLSKSLIKKGHNCTIINIDKISLNKNVIEFIKKNNINFKNFKNIIDFEKYFKKNKIEYVILDFSNKEFSQEDFLIELINKHSRLVCIDDITKRRLKAKLNFYPPIDWIKNENWKNFNGENYFGIEYNILKPELETFRNKRTYDSKSKYKFCITIGGSDPKLISIFIYKIIRKIFPSEKLCIIFGPLYKEQNYYFDRNTLVLKNPENFLEVVHSSENIITSFGITMYELYYLSKKTFFICSKRDHILSSSFFQKLDNFEYLGYIKELNEQRIIEKLKSKSKNFQIKNSFLINDRIIGVLINSLRG